MKTILYATDCSKKTTMALNYAYDLSHALNAELHVIHTYDLFPIITNTVRSRAVLEDNYHDEQYILLQKYCETHLKDGVHSNLTYHLEKSDTKSQAISNTARAINADLVLVGHKDTDLLSVLLTENVANKVMKKLECPLLVIPNDLVFHGLSTLLYATDFEESDIFAIEQLVKLAQPFGAHIKIIHIPRRSEQDVERKMNWFKTMVVNRVNYQALSFSIKTAEDVESGIQAYVSEDMPQMLVMMERERATFFERLFHKDMVKTMETELGIPLLVFNKKYSTLLPKEQWVDHFIYQNPV